MNPKRVSGSYTIRGFIVKKHRAPTYKGHLVPKDPGSAAEQRELGVTVGRPGVVVTPLALQLLSKFFGVWGLKGV